MNPCGKLKICLINFYLSVESIHCFLHTQDFGIILLSVGDTEMISLTIAELHFTHLYVRLVLLSNNQPPPSLIH